jgi:serine/threonine protein kinase
MAGFVSDLKLGDKLGNGAFGDVYKGEDPAHGEVAVKVLKRDVFHDDTTWPTFKATYLAEAKNLAKASHRNVVQVHHVVEAPDGDSVMICMSFCPGGSLQSAFEHGPMTLAAVRKVGTEVLMGLGAMHARGMVHRDIKPANILLNAKAEAQISDFGLVTDDLVLGYASQAGYLDHVAYEVWNGKGTSAKSDIWALGMTLYRLLHGKVWYDGSPAPKTIIKDGGFVGTLRWLPHVTKPWRTALRKMMNDDDSLRSQSSAQALNALAGLPTTPIWEVTVTAELVRWQHSTGTRRIIVECKRHGPRRHEWAAWSEPLGKGQNKRLAGSSGVVGSSAAVKGLEAFFA